MILTNVDWFIARTIGTLRDNIANVESFHAQQYMLKKGLKIFGKKGKADDMVELLQQHQCACFEPVWIHKLSLLERKRAMISLMLLTEKSDGKMKGRQVYNGKPTREWVSKENKSSPTVINEALVITSMVDTHEHRDVMGSNVPNAFV